MSEGVRGVVGVCVGVFCVYGVSWLGLVGLCVYVISCLCVYGVTWVRLVGFVIVRLIRHI